MANSNHWARYAAIKHLKSILDALAKDGHVKSVVLNPTTKEFEADDSFVLIFGGEDTQELAGVPGNDIMLDSPIQIYIWGSQTSESLALDIESLIARIRDKIFDSVNAMEFLGLDPPVEVFSMSVVQRPSTDIERDFSLAIIEVQIRGLAS